MSPILVPIQHRFLIWRAESLIAKAAAARGGAHTRYLRKAIRAIENVEMFHARFPDVTREIEVGRIVELHRRQVKN